MKCFDCPRACGVDRDGGEVGVCGGGRSAKIAKIIDRFEYEEPCLGSVTAVFFCGCSLKCSYCQNYKISRGGGGREYGDDALASVFDGAHGYIDLVTPTHYLTAIERALPLMKNKNAFVYNTSGYETTEAVERAKKFVDVFLTDYKYADNAVGQRFSAAPDYREVASRALESMRDVRDEWATENGKNILKRGLIVRHLVLPGQAENSLRALDDIKRIAGSDTVLSLMSQFTPNGAGEPSAKLKKIEYKIVAEHAIKLGFRNG